MWYIWTVNDVKKNTNDTTEQIGFSIFVVIKHSYFCLLMAPELAHLCYRFNSPVKIVDKLHVQLLNNKLP
jgi:hypothetical protein